MTTGQWLLLWGVLITFAGLLWGVLLVRLARKGRVLKERLRGLAGQPLDSPSPAADRQI